MAQRDWDKICAGFKNSGMSVTQYAQSIGLKDPSGLYKALRKRGMITYKTKRKSPAPGNFVQFTANGTGKVRFELTTGDVICVDNNDTVGMQNVLTTLKEQRK